MEIVEPNPLIGQSIRRCGIRSEYNIIIAIEKSEGNIITNPGHNHVFENGDHIVMIANEAELLTLFKKYKHPALMNGTMRTERLENRQRILLFGSTAFR